MRERTFPLPIDALEAVCRTMTADQALDLLNAILTLADGEDPENPLRSEADFAPFRTAAAKMRRTSRNRSAAAREIWSKRKESSVSPSYDDGASAFKGIEEAKYRKANQDAAQYILKSNIGMTDKSWQEFRGFTEDDGLPDDLIIWALDQAIARDRVTTKWRYTKKILDSCITQNIRTVEAAQAEADRKTEERKKSNERADPSGDRTAYERSVRAAQERLEAVGLTDNFV